MNRARMNKCVCVHITFSGVSEEQSARYLLIGKIWYDCIHSNSYDVYILSFVEIRSEEGLFEDLKKRIVTNFPTTTLTHKRLFLMTHAALLEGST